MTHRTHAGMTLVELMVALAIGVGVTLAVGTLLVAGENHKRTTTSTNDAIQTGAYASYALDRALRSAGSGIAQSAYGTDQGVLGCRLNVSSSVTPLLPRGGAFPVPFATNFLSGATSTLRVAPVLIAAGQSDKNTSDVLVVMGGSGAAGGVSRSISGAGGTSSLILQTTVGFKPHDLVLVSKSGVPDCLMEEVATTSATTLNLINSATYPYYTTGTTTTLSTLAGDTLAAVTPVGNSTANTVQFQMFGVGTNNTLYSYDLLQNQKKVVGSGADTSQAIADGVIQMNALYGVAAPATPSKFNNWANPADAAHLYDIANVMTHPATQQLIIAVRVAIVVRGQYADKKVVSPATLTIFAGLSDGYGNSLSKSIAIPDRYFRYRVFEFTVPLRDMILLAGGP